MNLSAAQILALPIARPEKLFEDVAVIDATYKSLAKTWHPDLNTDPKASDVLAHINVMYSRAKTLIMMGAWGSVAVLNIKTPTNVNKTFHYQGVRPFELGEIYICASWIVFACEKRYSLFCDRFVANSKFFKFGNADMKAQMVDHLPFLVERYEDEDRIYIAVATNKPYVRLADLIESQVSIDPKHVAWILSRMYGTACYLEYSGIRHLDISPESFFIVPETHEGALFGGWFYAAMKGDKPLGMPNRISLADPKNMPTSLIHLSMIKEAGKKLFKANSFYQLKKLSIPAEIRDWLMMPSGDNPFREYERWEATLVKAFGKRRFTEMKVSVTDVYKEI